GPPYPSTIDRPPDEAQRPPACSFRLPVCVHAGRDVAPTAVLGALADLERAAQRLSGGIGLPWPLADGALGGGPGFDVYLVPPSASSLAGAWEKTARDDPSPGTYDRASAFALLRADAPEGCFRRNLLVRAWASAVQWRIDAGEDPAVRESVAAYLAELAEPCGAVTTDLVDDFQAHPERALSSQGDAGPASAMPWPWYLDLPLGNRSMAMLPLALVP